MLKVIPKILPIVIAIVFIYPMNIKAEIHLSSRDDVISFVQAAFNAQTSLSEKGRTLDEIEAILSPFFSEESKRIFLEENLISENGLFITYGTDFPLNYIPFFSYTNETKAVFWEENQIYLFEYFPEQKEGPVSYESHYEGVLLTKNHNEWRIDQILSDNIPKEVIMFKDSMNLPDEVNLAHSSYQAGFCLYPIEFMFLSGNYYFTIVNKKSQ